MKTTMKKLLALVLCAACATSLAACGSKNATSDNSNEIPNPYVDCKTLDEAIQLSGISISVPDSITDTYAQSTFRAIKDNLIEITYADESGKNQIQIRKGTGTDDISGDNNDYAQADTILIGNWTVTCKGNNNKVSVATWSEDNQAYSVTASVVESGIAKTMMTDIVGSIDAPIGGDPSTWGPTDDSSAQISNPFVACDTLQDAAKVAGFDMTAPETIDGYSDRTIQAIENEMIQVTFANGDNGVLLRKAVGSDDVSGNYNNYAQINPVTVGQLQVTLKGNDGTVSVATWTDGDFSYAIGIDGTGLPSETVINLVSAIH